MNTSKPAANDRAITRNQLTQDEAIEVNDWVRTAEVTAFSSMAHMGNAATKALGFEVTSHNIEKALKRNKINHFERKAATAESATELAQAAVMLFAIVADSLGGVNVPADLAATLARHGIALPQPARKAA
jgi:RNase P protein component